jgi:phosphoserine aminotransferase
VLSLPFNGDAFRDVMTETEASLRSLLGIPGHYRVLFMHGGATAQFAAVPLNLLRGRRRARYLDSGYWSGKAMAEARRYCTVEVAASSAASGYDRVPQLPSLRSDAAYCHIVANETANGVQYQTFPESVDVPLVADMTSDFLTRPLDVSRFGVIYAGAQKNLGIAGLAVVVVREDLTGSADPATPGILDYGVQAQHASRYNTPPAFAIYLAGLVFKWLTAQGGLAVMEQANRGKSERVYAAIERSGGFYRCLVQPAHRSRVNVCFHLADDALTQPFLAAAQCEGLFHLAGHPSAGGMRASLYNAMPEAGAEALAQFMTAFAHRNG